MTWGRTTFKLLIEPCRENEEQVQAISYLKSSYKSKGTWMGIESAAERIVLYVGFGHFNRIGNQRRYDWAKRRREEDRVLIAL